MTIKCTGQDFNAFVDTLSDGAWFDDFICKVNGEPDDLAYSFKGDDRLPDDAVVEFFGGELHEDAANPHRFWSINDRLATFLTRRQFVTAVIEIPNGKVAMIKSMIEEEGVVFKATTELP